MKKEQKKAKEKQYGVFSDENFIIVFKKLNKSTEENCLLCLRSWRTFEQIPYYGICIICRLTNNESMYPDDCLRALTGNRRLEKDTLPPLCDSKIASKLILLILESAKGIILFDEDKIFNLPDAKEILLKISKHNTISLRAKEWLQNQV
ncbi:MAG: hypothetical protein J6C85_04400 [Alphaproteobacteria bacterium]|nr:hypothetical protein [Alphaproteobacteria bacterium]